MKRVYHALVKGNPGQGTVNAPIDHAEGHGTKREVKEGGKKQSPITVLLKQLKTIL